MKKLILVLSLCISFTALGQPVPDGIFEKINARLSYMENVGLYKAINQKAIEDVEREKVVIAKASSSAEKFGLSSQSIEGFFTAQISAAKAIQYRYRAYLLSAPETRQPRDLTQTIRPALLRLGNEINEAIAIYLREGGNFEDAHRARFDRALQQKYLTVSDKQALFSALQAIRLKP